MRHAEWVIAQIATAKAGLILVNINPAYRVSELDYALNKVGCKALITAEKGIFWGRFGPEAHEPGPSRF
jgi:acyl-CoA synthetase (AMP-forming)/AMP-acid ligase II